MASIDDACCAASAAAVVSLSDLPMEALDEIARRVGPLDNVACAAVCRSWRRALRTTRLGMLGRRPDFPRRISIEYRWNTPPSVQISAMCRDGGKPRLVRTVLDKAAARRCTCIIGCSYGWAITVDDSSECMSLLDPRTGRLFPLPPFPSSSRTMKEKDAIRWNGSWYNQSSSAIHKAVLAPGRRLGTYAVLLLHNDGRRMSYLRPGAEIWTMLRLPKASPHYKYLDVILHKGAFYTVSCYAEVNAWMPNGKGSGGLRTRRLTDPRREEVGGAALVESASGDDLLMVSWSMDRQRYPYYYYYGKRRYDVSRLDERERRWIPVPAQDIGETAIFIEGGCNRCVSKRGSRDPVSPGVTVSMWTAQFHPYIPRLDSGPR